MSKTYRDLRGVMSAVDVERPAWAEEIAVGDEITIDPPWQDEPITAEVAGFSSRPEDHGKPVVVGTAEMERHGLSGQVVIDEKYHIPAAEVPDA